MKESGMNRILDMVEAFKFGPMGPGTMAFGKMARLMEKEDWFMCLEISMKELGRKI